MAEIKTDKMETLINDHWDYVCGILVLHEANNDWLVIAEHHYKTAFKHGYKHGYKDRSNTGPEHL